MRTDWEEGGNCLRHYAQTNHGAPIPWAGYFEYSGDFRATAESIRDFGFQDFENKCFAHRPKDIDEIRVRLQVWKMNSDLSWGICIDTGMVGNDVPATWQWTVNAVGTQEPPVRGPCGNGNYRTYAFAKIYENAAWKPANSICTGGTTGCLRAAKTGDWHYFATDSCHVYPDTPGICPDPV